MARDLLSLTLDFILDQFWHLLRYFEEYFYYGWADQWKDKQTRKTLSKIKSEGRTDCQTDRLPLPREDTGQVEDTVNYKPT